MIYNDGIAGEPWAPTEPTGLRKMEQWESSTHKLADTWVPILPESVARKTPQGTPRHQGDDINRVSIKSSSSNHCLRYSPDLEFNSEQCSSIASSE